MIYFCPCYHRLLPIYRERFGYLASLAGNAWQDGVRAGYKWILDNGRYTGKFNVEKWKDTMAEFLPYAENCSFVVVPDVVGDSKATLEDFEKYRHLVLSQYKTAFVTQDGLQLQDIPFDNIDAIFIGGSDKHKLEESWNVIDEGMARGIWIHVGRVNTVRRIMKFWMVDSVDGNEFVFPNSIPRQHKIWFGLQQAIAKKKTMPLGL